MFIDPTLIQRQARSRKLTSFNQVVVICANQSFGEDGKSLDWLTYNEGLPPPPYSLLMQSGKMQVGATLPRPIPQKK